MRWFRSLGRLVVQLVPEYVVIVGVLGFANEPRPLDAERGVIRERGEEALLRGIEDDRLLVGEHEDADDARLHA